MKKILAVTLLALGLCDGAFAASPVPNYKWDFNLTNSASGTNLVYSTVPGADIQGAGALTTEAIIQMANSGGTAVNLLGLPGSGVGTNIWDRAVLLAGTTGGSGPIVRTPLAANTLTNLGIITNFTITAWVKADDTALSGSVFPRIFLLGANNADNGGLNTLGFLFFTGNNIQLKVHGVGANGISTSTSPLAGLSSDWAFVAVTYDATIDPAATTTNFNVNFYVGNRFNSLGAPIGGRYGTPNGSPTTVNSVFPASVNGPGYINFGGGTNGDGSYSTALTNQVYAYIGNRNSDRNRSFNGRYDDVRFYANTPGGVLTQSNLDEVRLSPGLSLPVPLTVTSQPQNATVVESNGVTLSVTTTPAPNPTYQWYVRSHGAGNTNLISGATNQTLVLSGLTVVGNNNDTYRVIITSTDPHAGTTNSLFAKITVVAPASVVTTPGMLKFEYFANAGVGASVGTFLGAPTAAYTNNAPDLTAYLPTFDTRNIFPDDTHFSYFVRITGSITPVVTTNYVFFIRAGDQGAFYLSTDGGISSNLLCSETISALQAFTGPESSISSAGGRFSSPIVLTAGTSYPITAFLKVGSTPNLLQVAWRTDSGAQDLPPNDANIADRLLPIPAAVLSTVSPVNGTVSISSPPAPASPSTVANKKVSFTVGVSSSLSTNNLATTNGPVIVQWRKNGVNIPGAVGTNYTTPYLTAADNGATFSVVASVPGALATSANATVTVAADNTAPTVSSAKSDDSMTQVTVKFSEPVDATTALNPANYSISGLTVTGVQWADSSNTNLVDSPAFDSVKLTTSLQADNTAYTVVVTGVQDTTSHTIAGGNSASFTSLGLTTGFAKFEYFETQTYTSLIGGDVNALVTLSPKFTNSDPDTVVYPTVTEMSPDGGTTIRSAAGGNTAIFPTSYGTRMSTIFIAPTTTNYVFYCAGNDSGLLWLSTNANPANKHVIAWLSSGSYKRSWTVNVNSSTATFATNLVGTSVTVPNATPWPVADANGFATISLVAGQRYYLEMDQFENAGFDSFDAVTYVTAADNTTVTAPGNGNASVLTGSVIGWNFGQPKLDSFVKNPTTATISWSGSLASLALGAIPYPGIVPNTITASFPNTNAILQSTLSLAPANWTTYTNASPATIPATNSAQFFRVAQ